MDSTRASLLVRVRNVNDKMAWAEFHRLYFGLIESYARARGLEEADAADVAAECMRVLVRKMTDFRYDRTAGRFRSYLRRMANNKVTDLLRKRRVTLADTQEMARLEDHSPTPAELWEIKWRQAHLRHCLDRLKQRVSQAQFEAFRLYAIEEWPVERVAEEMGMTPNQVYIAKTRLTAKLRELMIELLGEEQDPD